MDFSNQKPYLLTVTSLYWFNEIWAIEGLRKHLFFNQKITLLLIEFCRFIAGYR